ncbi:hypothetical protein OSCT_0706 [Oscillochloris trichoides DG-6]|uniref:Uncharacterized protein n=1 Tax=Oscillochloris trichoides DG-6 TaxID=765420 RepID=E1IBK5_9CHLR|nr:hypothetical protein [Oscillochloris trichoides]EFO81424.1 hypothetical protein OSCT_0706 [Oscillochloris trichoides DG-6]
MASRRRAGATCDFEELRPGLFMIHNPALSPVLRGEGEREGDRFRLTTWRGEGLIARLRARTFVVLTLLDQVAALPDLPTPPPLGAAFLRDLARNERISYFAPDPLGWVPVPNPTPSSAELREGWIVRRRRSRGPASYAHIQHGNFLACDEDRALRLGYAQVSPTTLTVATTPQGILLPNLPLPQAHQHLLGRIAASTPQGWLVAPESLPLVTALLARLGVGVEA